jgi:hypothetical protein
MLSTAILISEKLDNRKIIKARSSGENFMPTTPHIERHFTATEMVRDIVIGMSDG